MFRRGLYNIWLSTCQPKVEEKAVCEEQRCSALHERHDSLAILKFMLRPEDSTL